MQLIMQDTEARSFNANLRRMVAFSIGEADYNPSLLALARGCGVRAAWPRSGRIGMVQEISNLQKVIESYRRNKKL